MAFGRRVGVRGTQCWNGAGTFSQWSAPIRWLPVGAPGADLAITTADPVPAALLERSVHAGMVVVGSRASARSLVGSVSTAGSSTRTSPATPSYMR